MANQPQAWQVQSFEKGMVEIVNADKGEERVILMLNWNPTVNIGGLVRRQGQILLVDEQYRSLGLADGLSFALGSDLGANLLHPGVRDELPVVGGFQDASVVTTRETLYGGIEVLVNTPVGHATYHIFHSRRFNRTVGGVPENVLGVATIGTYIVETSATPTVFNKTFLAGTWMEPHTDLLANKGKEVLGLYQDNTVYGQTVIFVTDPRPVQPNIATAAVSTQEFRPAYHYKFHDYWFWEKFKAQEPKQYWHGVSLTSRAGLSRQHWKVEDDTFQNVFLTFSRTSVLPGNKTWYKDKAGDWEGYREEALIITKDFPSYKGSPLEVWMSETEYGIGYDPIQTYPYPEIPTTPNPTPVSWRVSSRWKYKEAGYVGIGVIKEAEPAAFYKEWWPDIFFPGNQRYPITSIDSSTTAPEAPSVTRDNYKSEVFFRGKRASYFTYYDYSSKESIPRPFHWQEPIPWKLTAVINGIEREIQNGVYTESHFPLLPSPPMPVKAVLNGKSYSLQEGELAVREQEFSHRPPLYAPLFLFKGWPNEYYEVHAIDAIQKACFIKFDFRIRVFGTSPNIPNVNEVLPYGITSFKLYVSTPSTRLKNIEEEVNILRKDETIPIFQDRFPLLRKGFIAIGDAEIKDFDRDIYRPDSVSEGFDSYKLVKEFLIVGESTPISRGERERYRYTDQGLVGISTNAWKAEVGPDYIDYVAITIDENGDPWDYDKAEDFYLWDYPTIGPEYANTLGTLAQQWKGTGARLVTNIKGRTFLAGPINEYFEEETGRIRFSAEQNGILSVVDFGEIDFIDLGRYPHTALTSFREQLWAFSESELYRVQMHDLLENGRWEILDKVDGQGTFHQKTVEVTPYGVAWCNRRGVWISDGREPSLLSGNVSNTYRWLCAGSQERYAGYQTPDVIARDDMEQYLSTFAFEGAWNKSMELTYDAVSDELVVSFNVEDTFIGKDGDVAPDKYIEVRLHYSFKLQAWWIEKVDYPETVGITAANPRWVTTSHYGKMKFGRPGLSSFAALALAGDVIIHLYHNKGYKYMTTQLGNPVQQRYVRDEFIQGIVPGTPPISAPLYQDITMALGFSHFGDAVNDSVTHSVMVGGTLVEQTPGVIPIHQTQMLLETRQPYYPDTTTSAYIRSALVDGASFWSNWRNYPQVLQSPLFALSPTRVQRESTVYLCPIATFRRARIFLFSNAMATLDNVIATYTTSKRKTYS